jgi:rSAM/selenodomain-associated transferase 1
LDFGAHDQAFSVAFLDWRPAGPIIWLVRGGWREFPPGRAAHYPARMSSSITSAAALVVFCRRPMPGVGKQRIAAGLGREFACRLGEALLETTLEDARAWPGDVILAPAENDDLEWAAALGAPDWSVAAQGSGNLGQRLNAVDRRLRARGQRRLVFIGSDAPLLDPDYYRLARGKLDGADVVLGPADDGGVTLMASRAPWPPLDDLPWSSDKLGSALERRCRNAGLSVATLPVSSDVDLPEQLPQLLAALADDKRPARRALADWLTETLQGA